MKTTLLLLAALLTFGMNAQNTVTLNINHKLGNDEFNFSQPSINNLGHDFEVTRLEYYISEITIVHDGGSETEVEDFWILADASDDGSYELGSFDISMVEAIRFHIGVDPDHNHEDPASYASDHPLAPQWPSMHWGWSAGYRFVAYEGYSGANLNQTFQLHGLEDPNYFETTVDVTAEAMSGSVSINLDADYSLGLKDIQLTSGVIVHGGYGAAKECLENFRDYVFSEAGSVVSVSEEDAHQIAVYPNPTTNGWINVRIDTNEIVSLRISDLLGKAIATYDNLIEGQIQQMQLPDAGMYLITVTKQTGETSTTRILSH